MLLIFFFIDLGLYFQARKEKQEAEKFKIETAAEKEEMKDSMNQMAKEILKLKNTNQAAEEKKVLETAEGFLKAYYEVNTNGNEIKERYKGMKKYATKEVLNSLGYTESFVKKSEEETPEKLFISGTTKVSYMDSYIRMEDIKNASVLIQADIKTSIESSHMAIQNPLLFTATLSMQDDKWMITEIIRNDFYEVSSGEEHVVQ